MKPVSQPPAGRTPQEVWQALRSVLMDAPACMFVLRGPEHIFELANQAGRQFLGGRPVEGLPVRQAVPELEGQRCFEILDRVYQTGEPFFGQEHSLRLWRGGRVEEVFLDFECQPVAGVDGKPEGVMVLGFDVTARVAASRRAEQLAAEHERGEQYLRRLVENSPYSVAMLDKDMRYLFASERWLSDFRLEATNEQLRGRSHYEVFPEIPPAWKEVHRRCLAGETIKNDAEAFHRADGRVDWIRWEIRPWRDTLGQIGGLLIFSEDISAKKRAEDELRRWEHVFQHASWGMVLSTPDNRFIAVNRAFAQMHGTQPEYWVGRPLVEAFAEGSKPLVPEFVRRVTDEGRVAYESIHRRADGSEFPVHTEVTAFTDQEGQIVFRAASVQDISERKRVERELELERRKFQMLVEGASFAVVVCEGPEHVVTFLNPAHDQMTGQRVRLGQPLVESLPEVRGSAVLQILDEVYRTGQAQTTRELLSPLQRDGRLQARWFDLTCQPMPDATGEVTSVLVSSVEVTEHVLARQRLEAAKRVTEAITANTTQGLIMMDARQHCTFMNPAAERITGFRLEQVREKPLHFYIHHSHPDGTPYRMEDCPIDRALPTKNQEMGEDVFVHPDGHFYPVAFTASPLLEGGRPVGTVLELRDTTREKAAQREHEKALADLRQAVSARDEFLSIASHELKTPLTPLQLQLESFRKSLARAGLGDERTLARLELATRQTHRLAKLVENLLDVSRISAGRLLLELEECDLVELVSGVVQRFAEEARAAGTRIELQAAAPVHGRWDRLRVEQVISNLLSNAIKYGDGKPIEVAVEAGGEVARLTVQDQGIGIDSGDLDRIFGRFERAVSMRHFGGLGLGLYIAHQIVEAHGGSIVARSNPGAGSTFVVVLPLEPLSSTAGNRAGSPPGRNGDHRRPGAG